MSSRADADDHAGLDLGERLRGRLTHLESAEPADITPERWAFRSAAAFLSWFDPVLLKPATHHGSIGGAVLNLVDDCDALGTPAQRLWALKPEIRAATLHRMRGRREALRALEANPELADDGVERIVREYLRGRAPSLESQSVDELSSTMQAVRWLSQVEGLTDIPSAERVAAVQQQRQLFEPLESLVSDTFHGRENELAELRLHVGVLEPSSLRTKVRSVGHKVLRPSSVAKRPLMVWGPGGIGKSTLLAKLVLDHARGQDELRIPFVYVDFERPTLSVVEPATLIVEAARQLAIQYPQEPVRGPSFAQIEAEAAEEATRQRDVELELQELKRVSAAKATVHRDLGQALRAENLEREQTLVTRLMNALRETACFAGRAPKDEPPLLLVLDSFEEAQYRSSPYLLRMLELNDAFQNAYPMVRVVVSGRVPVEQLAINRQPARYMPLEGFDLDSAIGFLAVQGVADRDVGRVLAQRFGGNPLVLKLAARLAKDAGPRTDWARDIRTRRWLIASIEESLIQSQLYERILGGLFDDDIRRLAHPGLVLRRITPEIIQEVLAEPCGVDVPDGKRANELFESFSRKVDLVQRVGPGTLAHRSDVRRVMLRPLEEDKPAIVEAIERRAVAYYTQRPGALARAEEIYHRLRLGESPRTVEARWEPGVDAFLNGAQQEVPTRAQSFLAAKLNGMVPQEVLDQADPEDWEVLTAREVEHLLDQPGDDDTRRQNARAALGLMRARADRGAGSPLYQLEAETLSRLADREAAERVVQEGISSVEDERVRTGTAVRTRLLDLLVLAAKQLADREQWQAADRELEKAERLAERLGHGIDVVATLLYRVRLRRICPAELSEPDPIRDRTARRFLGLSEGQLQHQHTLVRSLAVELGPTQPDVLKRAVDILGLDVTDDAQLDALTDAVLDLSDRRSDVEPWLRELAVVRGVRVRQLKPGVSAVVRRLAATGRLSEIAGALIAHSPDNSAVRQLLIAMLPTSAASEHLNDIEATVVASHEPGGSE